MFQRYINVACEQQEKEILGDFAFFDISFHFVKIDNDERELKLRL